VARHSFTDGAEHKNTENVTMIDSSEMQIASLRTGNPGTLFQVFF
jgi:hypothetical protein